MRATISVIEAGGGRLEVLRVMFDEPLRARPLRSPNESVLMAGLPRSVSPCAAALAYLYVLEDLQMGARVKNRSILFVMNLLGLKQIKDVIESVAEFRSIVVVGPERGVSSSLAEISAELGMELALSQEPPHCSIEELERITSQRTDRL
ncbi:MAG: hypothetical protein N3F67_00055 [Acidilobaceae archaeon]|nr:hypothetical protein [Acidilobaceae archaeon]